ncbi:MAG: hypothetical protein E7384_07175 [Ruminococcaceae bacterium]|nr:hypothetical protein [Oscillospiraceae bacterium]
MNAEKLQKYILQGICKKVYPDKIELYLPFFFGNGDETLLCLTWDKDGILSDGGRTISELKKRVGDISVYTENIHNVLNSHGMVELVSGHILTVRHYFTVFSGDEAYTDYLAGISKLIEVISLISVIDTIQVSHEGEVSV